MSTAARTFILAVAAVIALVGVAMSVTLGGGGWPLIAIGLVLALSVLVEGRYRGPARDVIEASGPWQRTGEREVDSETGEIVEVWFDPHTGRRRYEPLGQFSGEAEREG
ncbi:hypothetical protein [Novosphingobium sp. 9]|uniref:hypothetical protein n=1 Tax=Novosphingobium sp. 9 TaxID=2025349 RepID=UPI0021B5CCB9|nr:hypothetical protein [Novosphingobium sp. 9]